MKVPRLQGWLGPERRPQQWVLAAALLGLLGSAWLAGPDAQALQGLESEVTRWQATLSSAPSPSPAQAPSPQIAGAPWPEADELATLWPWLQQRLQAQGLQLLSLQPQAMATVDGLPEQTVLLRLQGAWSDWRALEQALDAQAPWWVVNQWQMLPAGVSPTDVRIELQARWGLWPPQGPGRAEAPRTWPVWAVTAERSDQGAPVFGTPSGEAGLAVAKAGAPPTAAAGLGGPGPWPVGEMRLLGIWRQAGQAHAVLAAGQTPVVARAGQRVGAEGYRVLRVDDAQVELVPPGTAGPSLRLSLGEKP